MSSRTETASVPPPGTGTLAVAVQRWASALCVVVALHVLASPTIAAFLPAQEHVPGRPEGLGLLLAGLGIPAVRDAVHGLRFPGGAVMPALAYAALLSAATIAWVGTIGTLRRHVRAINDTIVDALFRWSVVFAAVMVLATPVVVHDFWLSVAWGDEVARGLNPYATGVAHPADMGSLPLGPDIGQMTYGPLFALTSGGTILLAGGNVMIGALLLKAVLAAAWIGTVILVRRLAAPQGPAVEALAVVLTGWSPLALFHGIADGHNDVLFILPVVLWLWWVVRDRALPAAVALAGSIAIKYVSAPLLGLHVLYGVIHRRAAVVRWLASAAVSVVLVGLCVLVFYRSSDFFASTSGMRSWQFHTPAAALATIINYIGFDGDGLRAIVNVLVIAIAGIAGLRQLARPGGAGLPMALLWWLTGIVLGAVGHAWPWFIIWLLPFAALLSRTRLAAFAQGLALVAPFTLVAWVAFPDLAEWWRVEVPAGC